MLVYFLNHSSAPISLGGAERSLLQLVADWQDADPEFEPFFITKAPRGRFIDALEQRGWAYRAFPFRGWAGPHPRAPRSESSLFARGDYRSTLDMVRLLEERRPDLVVTNTLVAPWAAFAAAIAGVPHVWMVREFGDLDHGLTFQSGAEATFRDIGLLSQAVLVNSRAIAERLAPYVDSELVHVIYPQVDLALLRSQLAEAPTTAPFPHQRSGLKMTIVGRIAESKGQWRAIEAVGELHRRGVSASLCLVGPVEEAHHARTLERRARELGISDRVLFVGAQDNPMPFVREADLCLTTSDIEAFGRSTLEYMIAGKAVVATAGGGSDELVSVGETGYLFDPDRLEDLVAILERYEREPGALDPHGKAGAKRAQSFTGGAAGTAAAIELLRSAADRTPYRLPQFTRRWFEQLSDPRGRVVDLVAVLARRGTARLLRRA